MTPTMVPLDEARHGDACARLMCESEPWRTLGRTVEQSRAALQAPGQEAWVALDDTGTPVGLLLLVLQGALVGYVRAIVVHEAWRGRGLGAALMAFAEARTRPVSAHLFLMVSSFNVAAQRFYARLGYRQVGELPGFTGAGHSELLLWKRLPDHA